jgi:hypothetical protein
MDGEHDVPGGDQVDLAAGQSVGGVVRALERLQGEMQPALGPPRIGAAEFAAEPFDLSVRELQPRRQGAERFLVLEAVEVDPKELAIADLGEIGIGQVDTPILPVGVEQPGGDGAQLTSASSTAAIAATAATMYWRTSIPRSGAASASSITNG